MGQDWSVKEALPKCRLVASKVATPKRTAAAFTWLELAPRERNGRREWFFVAIVVVVVAFSVASSRRDSSQLGEITLAAATVRQRQIWAGLALIEFWPTRGPRRRRRQLTGSGGPA